MMEHLRATWAFVTAPPSDPIAAEMVGWFILAVLCVLFIVGCMLEGRDEK